MEKEDYILKKIRYFQGTIDDYATYWEKKISQAQSENSKETNSLKKDNDELNNAYKIIPVEK